MEVGGIIESNWDEVVDNFDNMNLKEKLLRGIYAYGFEKPSAIQQRAIIPCIRGRDVIAQAQSGTISETFLLFTWLVLFTIFIAIFIRLMNSGTGKTATFSIAILQTIDTEVRGCQALVLAPSKSPNTLCFIL